MCEMVGREEVWGGTDRQRRYAEWSERKKGGECIPCMCMLARGATAEGGREWEGKEKKRKWGMGGGGGGWGGGGCGVE